MEFHIEHSNVTVHGFALDDVKKLIEIPNTLQKILMIDNKVLLVKKCHFFFFSKYLIKTIFIE